MDWPLNHLGLLPNLLSGHVKPILCEENKHISVCGKSIGIKLDLTPVEL